MLSPRHWGFPFLSGILRALMPSKFLFRDRLVRLPSHQPRMKLVIPRGSDHNAMTTLRDARGGGIEIGVGVAIATVSGGTGGTGVVAVVTGRGRGKAMSANTDELAVGVEVMNDGIGGEGRGVESVATQINPGGA